MSAANLNMHGGIAYQVICLNCGSLVHVASSQSVLSPDSHTLSSLNSFSSRFDPGRLYCLFRAAEVASASVKPLTWRGSTMPVIFHPLNKKRLYFESIYA